MSKKKKTLDELLEEALVPENEHPYDIPKNWIWTYNKNIAKMIRGLSYKKNDVVSESENTLLVLRGGNIQEDKLVNQDDNVYVEKLLVSEEKLLLEDDIVLVSSTGSSKVIGKAAKVDKEFIGQTFGAFMTLVRPNSILYKKYLGLYFQSGEYRKLISNLAKGSNINNIKSEHLENLVIPLPPLNEQKKISNKIEILFAKIDEAQQLIREAKDTFEYRLAAILSVLFQKNVESVKNKSENEPYKLPVGWKWLKLSEVGILKRGKSKHRPRNDEKLFGGPYPFIQTGDVARAEKYIETYSQTLSNFGLAQSALFEKGTLCITIAANIADTALLNFDSCFPDSVVGFSSNHEYISNEYIHYYISTIKQELEHYAPATAQKNINLKVLNEVLVPIPPQEEYLKIIGAIKYLELKERSVFNLINLEQQINQLKQSILSKAFKGELGTNDPTDEPAIELLKSILRENL